LSQSCGPLGDAKQAEARRHGPIRERGFFEIANAIFVQRDPVMQGKHFPRGFRMGGIGVIKEGRLNETRNIDNRPENKEYGDGWPETLAGKRGHAEAKLPERGESNIPMRFRRIGKESVSCSSKDLRDASHVLKRESRRTVDKRMEFSRQEVSSCR
jgi:hypothetical protein